MKTLLHIVVSILLLAGLAACIQNDGHIGKRFGMWKVVTILTDGVPDDDSNITLFWIFQDNLIQMRQLGNVSWNSYGRCTEVNGDFILDFRNTDDAHPNPGSPFYSPAPATHMPADTVITLSVQKLSNSKMVTTYHAPQGTTYTYILKKWG